VPLLYADLACRDAVELATEYLEGALSWRARRSYERHLRSCPNCRAHFEQIRAMIGALGKVEPDALSPSAQADLIDVFRRYRDEHGDRGAQDPPDG
jgi:anti-sigma factor RsiW